MARTPLAQVTPNVLMNTQMLQAAWEAKVAKFCFVSSSAAYPPSGDRPVARRRRCSRAIPTTPISRWAG